MPKADPKKLRTTKNRLAQPPHPQRTLPPAIRKILISPLSWLVAAIGLVAAVIAVWEAYQQTTPEIHPGVGDPDPALILPFVIQNKSSIFDLQDMMASCWVPIIVVQDHDE